MTMTAKPRKSLDEMEAAGAELGIVCRECGCRDWRVNYTRQGNGEVRRQKICRHCGKRMMTREREAFDG